MALTESQALERLWSMVAAGDTPELTDPELRDLLTGAQRAAVWTASTAYAVGDKIVTTDRNGRLYVCRRAGTSEATEPDWGTAGSHYLGRLVDDGDDLQWRDAGPAFAELWDLSAAAHAGWLLKAGKAACAYDVQVSGQKMDRSQLQQHCLRMAAQYLPVFVG